MTYSERGGAQDGHGEKIFPRDNNKVDGEPSQPLPLGIGAGRLVGACDGWFGLVMAGVRVALDLAPVEREHFEVGLTLSVRELTKGLCLVSASFRGPSKRETPRERFGIARNSRERRTSLTGVVRGI